MTGTTYDLGSIPAEKLGLPEPISYPKEYAAEHEEIRQEAALWKAHDENSMTMMEAKERALDRMADPQV